jgi:hypothetical protein
LKVIQAVHLKVIWVVHLLRSYQIHCAIYESLFSVLWAFFLYYHSG